jgi:hypothetical protein
MYLGIDNASVRARITIHRSRRHDVVNVITSEQSPSGGVVTRQALLVTCVIRRGTMPGNVIAADAGGCQRHVAHPKSPGRFDCSSIGRLFVLSHTRCGGYRSCYAPLYVPR